MKLKFLFYLKRKNLSHLTALSSKTRWKPPITHNKNMTNLVNYQTTPNIDCGITKLPQIFIHLHNSLEKNPKKSNFIFPFNRPSKQQRNSETNSRSIRNMGVFSKWSIIVFQFFVLDEMLRGTRRFHEQDINVKKPYCSRDVTRKVMYNCNFELFSEKSFAADWRDSLYTLSWLLIQLSLRNYLRHAGNIVCLNIFFIVITR